STAPALRPERPVAAGGQFWTRGFPFPCIVRLTSAGVPDPSFHVNQPSPGVFNAVLLQPDGKLLVTGNFFLPGDRFAIARLDESGNFDSFYPTNGLGDGGIGHALARQADGNVLVGGSFFNPGGLPRQAIARLLDVPPNGPPARRGDAAHGD